MFGLARLSVSLRFWRWPRPANEKSLFLLIAVLLTGQIATRTGLASPGDYAHPPDSPVVISEFQAINETGISTIVAGKTVSPPDWIEIHNRGTEPVTLGGWYLTDDPDDLTKWALPAVPVVAGGFLVFFASGIQEQDHPENWPYRDQAG